MSYIVGRADNMPGRKIKKTNCKNGGTAPSPNMYRQPCGSLLNKPSTILATNCPAVTSKQVDVTNIPRISLGDTSAMYMGIVVEAIRGNRDTSRHQV